MHESGPHLLSCLQQGSANALPADTNNNRQIADVCYSPTGHVGDLLALLSIIRAQHLFIMHTL